MLLQMALFHSFLWLSNIPLYKYTTFSLSIHQSMVISIFNKFPGDLGTLRTTALEAGWLNEEFTQNQPKCTAKGICFLQYVPSGDARGLLEL